MTSVCCLSGRAVRGEPATPPWPRDLLDSLLPARRTVDPGANPARPSDRDDLFLIRYQDGLDAAVAMLDSVGECFAFAA